MIKGRISFVMLERRCYTPLTSIDTFPFSSPESFILRLDTFERFQERSDVRGVNSGPPLDDDFTVEGQHDTRRACDSTFLEDNKE